MNDFLLPIFVEETFSFLTLFILRATTNLFPIIVKAVQKANICKPFPSKTVVTQLAFSYSYLRYKYL